MNKTCLILGATSDVGRSTAYLFAQNGYDLILASRRPESSDQITLASDINIRYSVKVERLGFDAEQNDSLQELKKSIQNPINVLISVFGFLGNHDLALNDSIACAQIIQTNFTAHVLLIQSLIPFISKGGSIIGVSSVAGERGRQSNFFYGSAKAGFTAYLSGLRNYLFSKDIHVATIIPGFIHTKMIAHLPPTPKPLTASAQDVASAIFQAHIQRKNSVYVKPVWKWIMLIIKSIPEFMFKKMKL